MTRPDAPNARGPAGPAPRRGRRRKKLRRRGRFATVPPNLVVAIHLALLAGFAAEMAEPLSRALGGARFMEGRVPGMGPEIAAGAGPIRPTAESVLRIWAYLAGAPVLFTLHRTMFWRGGGRPARYVHAALLAVWVACLAAFVFLLI